MWRSFLRSAADFEKNAPLPTLESFLERNALISDMDTIGDEDDAIMLMTLHSAKGLEFPVVFIAGVQEGLLPHQNSIVEGSVEEERRLCYVGMTRAKKRLYLTWSAMRLIRMSGGFSEVPGVRSRFLGEIPDACMELAEVRRPGSRPAPAGRDFSPRPFASVITRTPSAAVKEKNKPAHAPGVFTTGIVVEHPKFGKGKIIATNGEGAEKIAVVDFDKMGEKKMFVAFAPLKIVG